MKKVSQKNRKPAKKPVAKKLAKKTRPTNSKFPRSDNNPFRAGSSYATAFVILVAHPAGLPRQKLVELLAKATGKSIKRAGFDVAVVVSPASASPTSDRHSSCRDGYGVEHENDHVVLRLPTK